MGRRFRIRTKHYNYMMVGFLLVGCVVVFGAYTKHKHKLVDAAARVPASIQSISADQQMADQGALHIAATGVATSKLPQSKNQAQLKAYFDDARKTLGNSQEGQLAYVILLRGLVPQAAAKNPKLATLCKSDKTCPIKVAPLYKFAIAQFAAKHDVLARISIQRDLVNSQLTPEVKKEILSSLLLDPAYKKMKPTSVAAKGGKIQLGPEIQYQILTVSQYESLKPKNDQLVSLVLKMAENSQDPIARRVMLQGLNKAYPKFSKDIASKASHLGVKLAKN